MKVAILFAQEQSIYKTLPDCDVWDIERDARNYENDYPVVAHPPCRAWASFRYFAKPRPGEKNLARLAVALVRINGGVLEHPKLSILWEDQKLPIDDEIDNHGGFTIHVDQYWFGHKARKATKLYICGCKPQEIPDFPIRFGDPEYLVRNTSTSPKPAITKHECEATPKEFALWLVDLAKTCARKTV